MKRFVLSLSLVFTPLIGGAEVVNVKQIQTKSENVSDENISSTSSTIIIYDKADNKPCKVKNGHHQITFNAETGRLRVCRQ